MLSGRLNTDPSLAFISNIIFAEQIHKHEPDAHVCQANRTELWLSAKICVWVLCMRCFDYDIARDSFELHVLIDYVDRRFDKLKFCHRQKRERNKANATMCYWLQRVKFWFEFGDISLSRESRLMFLMIRSDYFRKKQNISYFVMKQKRRFNQNVFVRNWKAFIDCKYLAEARDKVQPFRLMRSHFFIACCWLIFQKRISTWIHRGYHLSFERFLFVIIAILFGNVFISFLATLFLCLIHFYRDDVHIYYNSIGISGIKLKMIWSISSCTKMDGN